MSIQNLLISCLAVFHVTFATQCSINVKRGMHKSSPPLLLSYKSPTEPIYPSSSDPADIIFYQNDKFIVACPGISNKQSTRILEPGVLLVEDHPINKANAIVQCQGNNRFEIDGKTVSFTKISCKVRSRSSYSAILRPSSKRCNHGKRFEIGYDLGNHLGFLKTIELCHDEARAKTLWSHAIIEPVNQAFVRHTGGSLKNFRAASLYGGITMSRNEPYSLQVAYNNLAKILGGSGKVDDYLSPKTSDRKFLAKGHLIANADKIYKYEQDSTYFYANVVPMWQSINAQPGNWYFVEEYVRHLANNKLRKLDVYVGGFDILKIKNHEFYLYDRQKIPVPKVLFKCVFNKYAYEGICFLVANNPYIEANDISDYVVCKKSQACDNLRANHKDLSLGYLYCCNVKDFYDIAKDELGFDDEFRSMSHYTEMRLIK